MRRAFSLVELLVVIAVIAMLMGILIPSLSLAQLQSKIVVVNAELREIGLALNAYGYDHKDDYPPTRVDCMNPENYYQLPEELVKEKYLPEPPKDHSWRSTSIYDRFNPSFTYKYMAVGDLIVNRGYTARQSLWIPDGFPNGDEKTGEEYSNPDESPVRWVIFSLGPKFNLHEMKDKHYPVPKSSWYNPKTRKGVLTRMKLKYGEQIGSFENGH